MEICPNQPDCEENDEDCKANLKWCRQYIIKKAPSNTGETGLGFVPLTNFCHNVRGQFTQERGQAIDPVGESREGKDLTSCKFGDGSLVQRSLTGDYAACGVQVCDTTFVGGFESNEYDPRYRSWYINTKTLQKPNWLPPYPFFSLGIGVTYARPIYSEDEATGRQVFAGVLAVDYRCK
jgi:hypothetical protein